MLQGDPVVVDAVELARWALLYDKLFEWTFDTEFQSNYQTVRAFDPQAVSEKSWDLTSESTPALALLKALTSQGWGQAATPSA